MSAANSLLRNNDEGLSKNMFNHVTLRVLKSRPAINFVNCAISIQHSSLLHKNIAFLEF